MLTSALEEAARGLLCQFRLRWLINQLLTCFSSNPVSWISPSFSSSCLKSKTHIQNELVKLSNTEEFTKEFLHIKRILETRSPLFKHVCRGPMAYYGPMHSPMHLMGERTGNVKNVISHSCRVFAQSNFIWIHAKINHRIHNLHVFLSFNPWINIKKNAKIIHTKHKFCAMVARSH